MSRTLRNFLVVAVVTAVVGATSAAQAAQINSPVLRREHSGVGFFSRAPRTTQNAFVQRSTTPRTTLLYTPRVNTIHRPSLTHRLPIGAQHLTYNDFSS